jgi:two-component system sensor histidine kinase KdpD
LTLKKPPLREQLRPTSSWRAYAAAPTLVGLCTLIALLFDRSGIGEANVIMVYLLGVLGVALAGGRGPSALAAVLSVLSFNFFFVEPRITFAVTDVRYLITFAVMLVVGLVVSNLTVRFRQQAEAARQRERRTAALYALSREFASTPSLEKLLGVAVRHMYAVFDSQVVILLPCNDGALQPWGECSGWAQGLETGQVFGLGAADQPAGPTDGRGRKAVQTSCRGIGGRPRARAGARRRAAGLRQVLPQRRQQWAGQRRAGPIPAPR